MRIRNVCERSLLHDSVCSIFLIARYVRFPIEFENHGFLQLAISSCRKPTDAIRSRIVDLNALYQHPVPSCHFRFRFCRYGAPKVFHSKYLANPWEFHKQIFHCFIPLSDLYRFRFSYDTNSTPPPRKDCFIVFYWL